MSFYSSLLYYRPISPAPRVTGSSLAAFIAQLPATGAFDDDSPFFSLNVKFGPSIDQDDLPTMTFEGDGYIKTAHEIEWDIEVEVESIEEIVCELRTHDQAIYRADVMLGAATSSVMDRVCREDSPENKINLCLDTWSFNLGVSTIGDLESLRCDVGWMDVSLHGSGYLYPWTARDLVAKAEACPELQAVMELCRSTWPVPSLRPTERDLDIRKRMGALWPYDDLSKTWDWYWGTSESG